MGAHFVIGWRHLRLSRRKGDYDYHTSWRPRGVSSGPWLAASFEVVHNHGCAATRWGKQFGPCDCGGEQMMRAFVKEAQS